MLRLKCSSYESTIDNLEKEKASLLKVTKILSSSEDRVNSDIFSNQQGTN